MCQASNLWRIQPNGNLFFWILITVSALFYVFLATRNFHKSVLFKKSPTKIRKKNIQPKKRCCSNLDPTITTQQNLQEKPPGSKEMEITWNSRSFRNAVEDPSPMASPVFVPWRIFSGDFSETPGESPLFKGIIYMLGYMLDLCTMGVVSIFLVKNWYRNTSHSGIREIFCANFVTATSCKQKHDRFALCLRSSSSGLVATHPLQCSQRRWIIEALFSFLSWREECLGGTNWIFQTMN